MLLKSFYAAISVVCLQLVDCFEPKIVGGRPAKEEEFPFIVALRKSYNDEYFCSGSILTRKYALTAAHCMYYDWGGLLPPIIVSVTFGQTGLNVNDYTFFRNVSKIILHPDFNQETKSNDIAILEIRRHFPVTNILINHLKLPSHRNVGPNECQISGWGFHSQNEDEELSKDLFVADVKIVEFEECARMFKEKADVRLTEGMVCAGHENGDTDSCRGDSGGPLVCNGVLVGIVSAGIGCGNPLFPGIYTDIHHYLPWIESFKENSVGCRNNNSIMCFLLLFILNMFKC